MAEFDPGEDEFNPRVDNPDTLGADPILDVQFDPKGYPAGDGWAVTLDGSLVNGQWYSKPVQLLAQDPARVRALVRAVKSDIMIASDRGRLINGYGHIISAGSSEEIQSFTEIWVCLAPSSTTPLTDMVTVWAERMV